MENAIFKQIVMYIDEHDILNQDEIGMLIKLYQ